MSKLSKRIKHDECMRRFIDLANEMKNEGAPVDVVSWSLMSASAIYTTYSVAGNEGGLNDSGIDKVADAYRRNLANIQELKKAQGMIAEQASASADAADGGDDGDAE